MNLLQLAKRARAVLKTTLIDTSETVRPNSDLSLRRRGVIERLIGDLTEEINVEEEQQRRGWGSRNTW